MRYRILAHYQEEQRKGFVVTHQMDREFDELKEGSKILCDFTSSYIPEYCHHLDIRVAENNECL